MVNDTQDEFEAPENDLIQDTDQLDNIPVYEQLNQKFHKLLENSILI